MDYIVVARLLSCAAKLSIDRYSLCVGYLSQPGSPAALLLNSESLIDSTLLFRVYWTAAAAELNWPK
jgi:hypothetical protein